MALVALLALSSSGERTRNWLQSMLWGSRETAQAQSSLRRELSNLAHVLDKYGAGELLLRNQLRVGIAIDRLTIDVHAVGTQLPDPRAGVVGELLEGLDLPDCEEFEDWLRAERSRIVDLAERVQADPPTLPVRDALGADPATVAELLSGKPPRLPPKPSVAVVPLAELSPSDGWLGQAVAEEISGILSQYPQLFIVASSAARALAGSNLSRLELARRLGVRYLVEGSVVEAAGRLRVMVALIDGSSGEQMWAETFAGTLTDMFDLQSEIARRIAPQIWTKVDTSERRISLRRASPPSEQYDLYWRANALFRSWQREPVAEAVALAQTLVAQDPNCPWANSLAGFCYAIQYMLGFTADREACRHRAISHFQTTIRHGDDNVEALGYAAGTLVLIGGELAIADRLIAQALNLLPAHQPTLFWGGWVDVGLGNPVRARERFELAMRVNPATGARGQTMCGIGFAALQQGRPDEAAQFFRQALLLAPEFSISEVGLCVAAQLTGDSETAAPLAARLLANDGQPPFIGLFPAAHQDLILTALRSAR
jgi:TolB-like protein